MAASLRNGFSYLFQACKARSQGTAAVRCLAQHTAGNPVGGLGKPNLLSSSIVKSYLGSWSPAWHTANSAQICSPVQAATPLVEQVRTKVRYSRNRGKPKTVHSVPARFYRLNWGIWIRTRAGRAKRLWKKTEDRKHRLRQHVFCNRTQSRLLDKMVTDFWRRPKYWVDDPYEPYHKRENLDLYFPKSRQFFP
ncbi:hypothetical protein ACOMHN_059054 [Nucella lapillus]